MKKFGKKSMKLDGKPIKNFDTYNSAFVVNIKTDKIGRTRITGKLYSYDEYKKYLENKKV